MLCAFESGKRDKRTDSDSRLIDFSFYKLHPVTLLDHWPGSAALLANVLIKTFPLSVRVRYSGACLLLWLLAECTLCGAYRSRRFADFFFNFEVRELRWQSHCESEKNWVRESLTVKLSDLTLRKVGESMLISRHPVARYRIGRQEDRPAVCNSADSVAEFYFLSASKDSI